MQWTEKDAIRFWSKVDKSAGEDGCWEWAAFRDRFGYGKIRVQGRYTLSHRLSAAMAGLDVEGLCVCHRCDNPACVNPAHLFAGTQADNVRDMLEKGRGSKAKGRDNGQSKLTEENVVEIKARLKAGESQRSIAKGFSVSQMTVCDINTGKHWKHVN